MNYTQWNDLIGEYLFGSNDSQKEISLYMTKDEIVSLYDEALSDEDKWKDFVHAINNSGYLPRTPWRQFAFNNIELIKRKSPKGYPKYLSFLIILIIAKAETVAEISDANFYQVICDFFVNNKIKVISTTTEATEYVQYVGGSKKKDNYWKILSDWCSNTSRGILDVTPIGNKYVGVIKHHCLLSRNQIERLPDFFVRAHITKDGTYTLEEIKRKILIYNNNFSDEIIRIVNGQNWKVVVSVIYNYFKNEWDGRGVERSENRNSRYTVIPLHLCLYYDSTYKVCFRAHTDIEDYESLKIFYNNLDQGVDVFHERDGWSCRLKYSEEIRLLADRRFYTKYSFDFNCDFYILHPNSLGEYCTLDMPIYEGQKLLILSRIALGPRQNLVNTNITINEEFTLYQYEYSFNDDFIENNTGSEISKYQIELSGGLLVDKKTNKYLSMYLPIFTSNNISDKIPLILTNTDTGQTVKLEPVVNEVLNKIEESIKWELPADLLGKYSLSSTDNEYKYSFEICEENIADIDAFADSVKLDCYGKVTDGKSEDYFSDNEIHYLSQSPDGRNLTYRVFTRNKNECHLVKSQSDIKPSFGDVLIDWLYNRGTCSKKEFERTFFFLQEKYVEENSKNYTDFHNNNIQSTIDILRAGGYIEVDRYRNIIPCNPRFIALPINAQKGRCNVAKLVGCRSINIIQKIKKDCDAYTDYMSFCCSEPIGDYLKFRLVPSTIYVELRGDEEDEYGYSFLKKNVCIDCCIKEPDFYFAEKMKKFLPSITIYDEGNWVSLNDQNNLRSFFCTIFNPETKKYDDAYNAPSEFEEYFNYQVEEQNVSLVKVQKTKYKITFVLIKKSERIWREIYDEGMGKFYVIHHFLSYKISHPKMYSVGDLIFDRNTRVWKDASISSVFEKQWNDTEKSFVSYVNEIAVMKRTRLPRLLDRFMNLVSLDTPYLCMDIDTYRESCPFMQPNSECINKGGGHCPHRYYLFSTNDESIDRWFIDSVIKDKLKLKY